MGKLESSTNLDEFMQAMGVGLAKRTIGAKLKPGLTFTITADGFEFTSTSGFSTTKNSYKWGQDTDDKDPVGVAGVQVWNINGTTMTGTFTYSSSGNKIEISRTIVDGKIHQTMKFNGKESTRIFKKL